MDNICISKRHIHMLTGNPQNNTLQAKLKRLQANIKFQNTEAHKLKVSGHNQTLTVVGSCRNRSNPC